MEGALFIVIVFGGGMVWLLSKTDIGRAVAERIRREAPQGDPMLLEEVERLRHEVAELHERMDFAERLLAEQRVVRPLGAGQGD
jgi:hypothetical protein